MSENYGNDPEKMLDWNKKLGEQSEYVKKVLKPFLNKNITANSEVVDLFNDISEDGVFRGDELPVVEQLIHVGIEGIIKHDRVDIYDKEYWGKIVKYHYDLLEKQKENFMSKENLNKENFKWENAEDFSYVNEDLTGDYLKNFVWDKKVPSFFVVGHLDNNNSSIMFFRDSTDIMDHKAKVYVDSTLDIDTAKKIVEKTVEHLNTLDNYKLTDMKEYIIQQLPEQTIIIDEWPETSQTSDRKFEVAQKTGYVQGVCESVLAFNTDENREIMSESTMTFLSKKLLSEMNVTKDMAQKFANPETYKALEKMRLRAATGTTS